MKVLITGSSGFLGTELKKILLKKKYKCFFLTQNNQKKLNHYYCPLQNHKNLKFILNVFHQETLMLLALKLHKL